MLMISWGVITAVLVVLVIYRVTLSSKEDDQIFIDAAEQHHYQEQLEIIARIQRLTKPIIALGILSGALLLASACLLYTSPSPRDLSTSRMPSSA